MFSKTFRFAGLALLDPEKSRFIAFLKKLSESKTLTTFAANLTLAATHFKNRLASTGATNVTLTVPLNATVAFPIGSALPVYRTGAGTLTIAGEVGVTITPTTGKLLTVLAGGRAELLKTAVNTWILTGDLTAA